MDFNSSKNITKTLILIFVISVLSDRIFFSVFNKISDEVFTGQTIGKLNQYLQNKDTLDLIVFGSSRANHHVNPIKILKNSFNMGMDGRKIAYSATLIKLLPRNKKQIILLHIDPESAFSQDYLGNDIMGLSSKYNRNDIIKHEMDKLKQNNLLQNLYWSISYNRSVIGILKNYFIPNYDFTTYFGYDPIYVSENQKKIFSKILQRDKKISDCQDSFILNKIYNDYIDELIEFCNENNKILIFFTSPKFDDKCENDNFELIKLFDKKNLNYHDFTNLFKENNNLDYWKDQTHLSNKGAELFTKKVAKMLRLNQ
jgi:hypothetical protein